MPILTYIHDPMCSWCYGFSTTYKALISRLPPAIRIDRLIGGLAPDSDEPMTAEMRDHVHLNWQRIEKRIPGVIFNYDFWTKCKPRRSTYPACRAVIAARQQDASLDMVMTAAIQDAYYQQARNPSDTSTLIELAAEIGLDQEQFKKSLDDPLTQQQLDKEILASAQLGVSSFPTLRLQVGNSNWPIAINYTDATEMLDLIEMLVD